ncbi:6-hydroxymethylpterin diphosphokinase MptE-like protein [Pseudodesulfovibrio sp. zrk46]|uniref:motility associated factor glycosyltransferase family protein n=1 Tax=Pseudodesulfovibrio sp. zrk46 TaxID=2725288 RepID=UPI0014494DD4|nr:6-hydroxymethylpterin diphosphokinase MptE-like protein [Pseudodesulfovibrio sp. zrk46]QJB55089.1 motility associated factor glycosyltransferase family protein [Pseudodesulfovibrio sp. zrk46]
MTAYPFLQDNIEYLQRTGNPIYQWLSTQEFKEELLINNIFINELGIHDWRMESGKGMFETLPPDGLYGTWLSSEKPESSATFIVGANLGYGVNHVLANTPDSHKVMLIEPRAEMLLACLGQTDYRPFFEAKKFHIMVPDQDYIYEVIRNLDLQFVYGQIHLKGDIASQQLGPEYAQWARIVRDKLENFSLELSTLRFKQDVMVGNEIRNFKRALSDGSLKEMEGKAGGVGAVILGAGPSLEKHAPDLKKSRSHVLYTCALQTVPVLQNMGIKPHFCLAIDYDKTLLDVFERLDPDFVQDIPLIYSTKVNPDILKRYTGPTIPLWTVGGMGTYVMKDHDLVLDAGGNVSVTLSRFLRRCGVSHICMVGQDYAWLGNRSHSSGHHSRYVDIPLQHFHQHTTNMDGEEILTTIQYMTAKREVEDDLRQSPFPVYNIYGGGVEIKGTKAIDINTAYKEGILASAPGSVDRFMTELMACRDKGKEMPLEPRGPMWSTSLRNAEKHLAKLFRNLKENQQAIHETMNRVEMFIKQDPLYMPYLFNEAIDMAGLTRAKFEYEPKDFPEFKRIAKCVMKKVREIDRLVCVDIKKARQAVA